MCYGRTNERVRPLFKYSLAEAAPALYFSIQYLSGLMKAVTPVMASGVLLDYLLAALCMHCRAVN